MIRELPNHGWRRRFAFLPFTVPNGPTKTLVWLEPYWSRCGGYFTEVSLTSPHPAKNSASSPSEASAGTQATDEPNTSSTPPTGTK